MKRIFIGLLALTMAVPAFAGRRDVEVTTEPGYFDFGDLVRFSNGEESVEVNLEQPLLSLVESIMKREEPELANLIESLYSVRVNMFSFDGDKRGALERGADSISGDLKNGGWDPLVKVKSNEERVYVYLKPTTRTDDEGEHDVISGLVVAIIEGEGYAGDDDEYAEPGEAVFVNIVGNFDIDAIAYMMQHFEVENLDDIDWELEHH
jgi:hypothetical protein